MSTVVKDLGAVSAYAYAVEKGYTGTEAEFAELMADYAEVGQRAEDAAESALNSKTDAQTAATTATNKASEATTAAQTATTKAGEASASASTATSAKDTAVSASQTATTKATEATTAAATATSAATTATTAKDDAVSAKTAAQTAQAGAETAAASVQSSAAQIQTNADDISELKEDLNQKANQDGYYADLVSGGSTQLLSDMVETDTTPYNYRTAGGSLEIGDREKLKKIVGGSLAVNQLVQNGNFANTDNWSATNATGFSVSDGVASFTPTAQFGNIHQFLSGKPLKANHVIFAIVDMKADGALENCQLAISDNVNFTRGKTITLNSNWQSGFLLIKETTVSLNNNHTVAFRTILTSDFAKMYVKNAMLFDLTAMFGTTIADYVYSLETATAGAGVEWLKAHFPRIFDSGYIPYNAGTLEHVSGLSAHKMVGFNQWDEEWKVGSIGNSGENIVYNNVRTKNYNNALPSTTYYIKSPSSLMLFWYDVDKVFISSVSGVTNTTVTSPSNAAFFRFRTADNYGTTYNHDICINLSDPAKNGTYEPYKAHSYPLDSTLTLRGLFKLDANNKLYADGDTYDADGKVTRKYGIVDLGTLTWEVASGIFKANVPNFASPADYISRKAGFICQKYPADTQISISESVMTDKTALRLVGALYIKDTSYVDSSSFKTAMSGVYLVYELATPTTESADPYQHLQQCDPNGTEEYVSTGIVPVGHVTQYPENLKAKIEGLPWNFANLIAPTESTFTATRNYTTGALFIVDNVLYKATSNIANGGTITPNTNCTATTLAEIISALA